MQPDAIARLIEQGMPGADVSVVSGDNTHFEARVISAEFEGLSRIKRHQKVYGCLGERVGREIHALALKTHTPDEWNRRSG